MAWGYLELDYRVDTALGDYMLSLGSAIKELRKQRGLTQVQLARKLKVTATYVSHLEADRRDPSMGFIRLLAREMDVPVSLIISVLLLNDLPQRNREQIEPILAKLIAITR